MNLFTKRILYIAWSIGQVLLAAVGSIAGLYVFVWLFCIGMKALLSRADGEHLLDISIYLCVGLAITFICTMLWRIVPIACKEIWEHVKEKVK